MRILVCLAQPGNRLSLSFQILLNAAMQCAAEVVRGGRPLPPLYKLPREKKPGGVIYQAEPWAGQGVEEFADPWTVLARSWGDCDDLVIYRGAELIANGFPCHARIIFNPEQGKYHTQLRRDFGEPCVEDPSLERLGKPVNEWLIPC